MSLWRRGKRAENALRTLGGALGRRGVMTISSFESRILCVISKVGTADFIHSQGPCPSIYRCLPQPFLMDENYVLVATRPKSRKCSEDTGGRPREKSRHDRFVTWIMHPVRHFERVKCWLYSLKRTMSVNLQMSSSAMFNGRKQCPGDDTEKEQEMVWARWGAPSGEEPSWPFRHLNQASCASFRTCEMLTLFTQKDHVG